ncbi:MAG: spore coat protein U domain-containing protein [Burkholderiaceae bacterium]
MKKLALGLFAATAFAGAIAPLAAGAATTASGFNVTVNLTSACQITSAPTDVAFNYASFQATPAVASGGAFSVRCTNSLPYTFSLDASAGTVLGLAYTLSPSAAGGTGNGAAQSYSIGGGMIADQSGTCAGPAATICSGSTARTLTITY